MKLLRKLITVVSVIMLFLMLTSSVCAAQSASITLQYKLGNCSFSFYKVADFSVEEGPTPAAPFDKYVNTIPQLNKLDSLTTDEMRTLAHTLDTLVHKDKISYLHKAKTDSKGKLVWNNPDQGIYLVVGQPVRRGDYLYTPSSLLVSLPNRQNGEDWNYNIEVLHNKYDRERDDEIDIRVMKLWINTSPRKKLPESVTVDLLRDGKVYDTVKLSAKNDWMYKWYDLPADHVWRVTEVNIPKDYTMTVERDGKTFVIRNTYRNKPPGGTWDTGQLWWPVPLMAAAGVTFLVIGRTQRRRRDEGGGY